MEKNCYSLRIMGQENEKGVLLCKRFMGIALETGLRLWGEEEGFQSERNKYRKGARSFSVFVPHAPSSTPAHKLLGLDQIVSLAKVSSEYKRNGSSRFCCFIVSGSQTPLKWDNNVTLCSNVSM